MRKREGTRGALGLRFDQILSGGLGLRSDQILSGGLGFRFTHILRNVPSELVSVERCS